MANVEKRQSNFRTILLALSAILLSVLLVLAGTYSLFTDKSQISNHLQAGTLEMVLTRTTLTKRALDDKGYLKESTDTQEKDFTGLNGENVFGLGTDEVLAPGSKYVANMRLTMTQEADVAFGYYVEIVLSNATADSADFRGQMKVTIQSVEDPTKTVSRWFTEVNNEGKIVLGGPEQENLIGKVEKGTTASGAVASQNFIVTVEFVNQDTDGSVNNIAKLESFGFDLVVYAIQIVPDDVVYNG